MKKGELLELTRELTLMARIDCPLSEALKSCSDRSPYLMEASEAVERGDSISQALSRYPRLFSPTYRAMIEAAEGSGRPAPTLEALSRWLEREDELRTGVTSALTYPIMVLALLLLQLFLLVMLLPANVLPLYSLASSGWTEVLGGGILLLLAGLMFSLWRNGGVPAFLPIPGLRRVLSLMEQSLWCRAMGTLVGAGFELPRALRLSASLTREPAAARLADQVERGSTLSQALAEQRLWPLVQGAATAGEKLENLAPTLLYTADRVAEDAVEERDQVLRMVEPAAVVVVGLLVLTVLSGFWATFYGGIDANV